MTGAAFVPDGAWPPSYNKSYLFGDYVCGEIFKLTPKSTGGYSRTTFATGLGLGGPVAMTFGPTGRTLYYTTFAGGDGGQIRAISYNPNNQPPTARIKITGDGQNYGPQDKQYQFTGAGSSDPDKDHLTYKWDFGDGSMMAGATPSHTYSTAGKKAVTLTVRDGKGRSNTATTEIFAGNTAPPAPKIEAPLNTLLFKVGQEITLSGSATDADDGPLADSRLRWEVRQYHNNSHSHPYFSGTGNDLKFTAPAPEDLFATNPKENFLQIRLTATDSQGLQKTVTRRIEPKTVNVWFASWPTDFRLVVNGKSFKAPKTIRSWVGYRLNVFAPKQRHDGKTYVFRSWSDGCPARHTARHTIVTAPEYRKYIAKFKRG